MPPRIALPGLPEPYRLSPVPDWPSSLPPARSRRLYAAAHVVARPGTGGVPEVDWDETLAVRHWLWRLGMGVADAMDTAQRGMGIDWATTAELIRRVAKDAASCGGALVCGANTDQLEAGRPAAVHEVVRAYEEQIELIEGTGAGVVLMASRALAATARDAADYERVYGALLEQVNRPVILHWLGPMFDPALTGYWGSSDLDAAEQTVLRIVGKHPRKVDGIKLSLLDRERENGLRKRLPEGVRLYTGDDFHYPEQILGDGHQHSDALLGILDAIAAPAATAVRRLDEGDHAGYHEAMSPTVPLARHVFSPPTFHYKTGLAFLSWLAGRQSHFLMLDGQQAARDTAHLVRLFVLADRAGLLTDPDLAVRRMETLL